VGAPRCWAGWPAAAPINGIRSLSTTSPPAGSCTGCSLIGIPSKAYRRAPWPAALGTAHLGADRAALLLGDLRPQHYDALEAKLALNAGAEHPSSPRSHAASTVLSFIASAILGRRYLEAGRGLDRRGCCLWLLPRNVEDHVSAGDAGTGRLRKRSGRPAVHR
jgi:hypothetical protein